MNNRAALFLSTPIQLAKLELFIVDLPQKSAFQSAIGIRNSRQAIIVRWTDTDGAQGYGECSCRPDPFYSAEFLEGVALVIQQFLFPALTQASTFGEVIKAMDKVRGWPFAKASIEMAANDLIFQKTGKSIFDYWGRPARDKIPVGISIGLQKNTDQLLQTVTDGLDKGYRRLKFKIHPAYPVEQAEVLLDYKDKTLISFDANGSLGEEDFHLLEHLTRFGTAIEQPFPPHHIGLTLAAKKQYPNLKICPDEGIKDIGLLMQAHMLGAIDELNIKPGRVGGLYKSIAIANYCQDNDIPCWVGGMFETSIGRACNIQFAARLDTQANDLSPSSRYFKYDLVDNPITMDEAGYTRLAEANAISVNTEALQAFTQHKIELIHQ
jgi:O-succinylbenzoate synthase